MNTKPKTLVVHEAVDYHMWEAMGEEEREEFVRRVRVSLAATIGRSLLEQGYIKAHDSVRDICSPQPCVVLSTSIRVGYTHRTAYAEMPFRMLISELWARLRGKKRLPSVTAI